MPHTMRRAAWLLCLLSAAGAQQRWSRQISTADASDWVPLTGPVERPDYQAPVKRQAIAQPRILAEPFPGFPQATGFRDPFQTRNVYQNPANLYLQSVPTAPQNYIDQSFGQNIRFGLSQPNFPLSQGFVSPQLNYDFSQQGQQFKKPPTGQVSFPKNSLPTHMQAPAASSPVSYDFQKGGNVPPLSPQAKPFVNHQPQRSQQAPPQKTPGPKFVDGYRLENSSSFSFPANKQQKKPQSLQKMKFENFDNKPRMDAMVNRPKSEREEVQLLYMPVESLNRGQFNFKSPIPNQPLTNPDLYQGIPKTNPLQQPSFAVPLQAPAFKPLDKYNFGQEYFPGLTALKDLDQVPKFSTITSPFPTAPPTTPKPKKLKPHQPPLAVFLSQEAKKGEQVKVADVLLSLKNARTIAVLDTVSPANAPKVFIGPSSLAPPENFVKFELPYLSNIENTDRKLRQLPFFVAPLSYSTPEGFAKIPFPSPHVGSVIVNSQVKEPVIVKPSPSPDVIPNSYTASPPTYRQEQKAVTQKPTFSYYSTAAPHTNPPKPQLQSNYYSFEPQTVTSIKPKEPEPAIVTAPPNSGSYYLGNNGQYKNQYLEKQQPKVNKQEPLRNYEYQSTPRVTTQQTKLTSTQQSSTYPSQLLETHNPYSINQAFHLSTPLDINSYFDDNKEGFVTPSFGETPAPTPSTTAKPQEIKTEKPNYQQQSSPNYLQNYNPEIHYESDVQNSRYPVYEPNAYTNTQPNQYQNAQTEYNTNSENKYGQNNFGGLVETQAPVLNQEEQTQTVKDTNASYNDDTTAPELYNQFLNTESEYKEPTQEPSTTTTTTTTTRRAPLRTRGRPRYTTQRSVQNDNSETTTARSSPTRRPLRERRPLPSRPKYEPNKITTERSTRTRASTADSSESTTKSSRSRTRGRVQFKPSEYDGDESGSKRKQGGKEQDLAYQRDVLHQNYPVTLMERTSTTDIEAMTEPTFRLSSTRNFEPATPVYDTEHAFSNEQPFSHTEVKETEAVNTRAPEPQTETPAYVPRLPTTREEYVYHSRSSAAPVEPVSNTVAAAKEEIYFSRATTPSRTPEYVSIVTEPINPVTEQILSKQSEYAFVSNEEEPTTTQKITYDITETERVEEDIPTTSAYNRVRVRPGGIRPYIQQTTTEAPVQTQTSRPVKTEFRRRPAAQAVTYRPAFDKRRTTMRIDEIEADLKTKPIRSRPDTSEYRHPVYKPEPTTQPPATTSTESTKRGQFRRRRPTSYASTSTEGSVTRKAVYDTKNRFRGRRPTTEKPLEKPDTQTEAPATTTPRNIPYSRYTRPRLSERYNKKPEPTEDTEIDQETNYSFNRPKFASPDEGSESQWSAKFSADTFKPYNPNEIQDDKKIVTTERKVSDDMDIITARNEYDDILLTVTPATNKLNKKVPDIPPTLEALVEQSKVTQTEPGEMSTFESMLEEVMKSLEEQDENEYSTNVMKHKGGEIGEIPPENVVNDDKTTTVVEREITTVPTVQESSPTTQAPKPKGRRRGFWKKVQVRPVTTESIEVAESQYYTNTVNHLGQPLKPTRNSNRPARVTTYKPNFNIKDFFDEEDKEIDAVPNHDIPKLSAKVTTEKTVDTNMSPGDIDLGTGSPDVAISDMFYNPTSTEASSEVGPLGLVDRSDGFSFMDYLFGVTAEDTSKTETEKSVTHTTEPSKIVQTTESSFVPEEITETIVDNDEQTETNASYDFGEIKKVNSTEQNESQSKNADELDDIKQSTGKTESIEATTQSIYMDPENVVSTSMSTEVSHETEICFRGKCIKTKKDIL